MEQTLTVRPRTSEVRLPDGTVYLVVFAHCSCPDQLWRDSKGKVHLCKHIVRVYGNTRLVKAMKSGQRSFRMSSDRIPGVIYTVTVFSCSCGDFKPGVMEMCEHLRAAYNEAGFPASPNTGKVA